MKNIPTPLQIPALKNVLSGRTTIPKTELRNFYQAQALGFNEQLFRRALYALENKGILIPLGAGMYIEISSVTTPAILDASNGTFTIAP